MQYFHLEALLNQRQPVMESGPTIKRELKNLSPRLEELRKQIRIDHDEHTKRLIEAEAEARPLVEEV